MEDDELMDWKSSPRRRDDEAAFVVAPAAVAGT